MEELQALTLFSGFRCWITVEGKGGDSSSSEYGRLGTIKRWDGQNL